MTPELIFKAVISSVKNKWNDAKRVSAPSDGLEVSTLLISMFAIALAIIVWFLVR